jgi:hypothetical protein
MKISIAISRNMPVGLFLYYVACKKTFKSQISTLFYGDKELRIRYENRPILSLHM